MKLDHLFLCEAVVSPQKIARMIEDWVWDYYGGNDWGGGVHRVSLGIGDRFMNRGRALPTILPVDGLKLKKIGTGTTRYAYLVEGTRYVAKISYDPFFNRKEKRRYEKSPTNQRRYLARVVAISPRGFVSIMEYIPNPSVPRDIETIQRVLPNIQDLGPNNLRRTAKGHPKMVDYEW